MTKKKRKPARPDKQTRFSTENQPTGRGRRKSLLTSVKGKWDARLAARMAGKGVESDDIVELLGIEKRLQDADFRAAFDKIVRNGHSRYRAKIQDLASKNAERHPTVLSKELGAWSPRHRDDIPSADEYAGVADRILALIDKAKVSLADRKAKAREAKKGARGK